VNIAIRVDASDKIGTGHLVRCLTLADAIRDRGATVRFLVRHIPDHHAGMVRSRGHELVILEADEVALLDTDVAHAAWLGTSQSIDSEQSLDALADHAWDWVIADHYALDHRWESAMRTVTRRIMVIDDLADRRHDCDLLLDQNLYADGTDRYAELTCSGCQLLIGPRFALLRKEFSEARVSSHVRAGAVKSILVFFGGVDPDDHTSRAIELLAGFAEKDWEVNVVIGQGHPKLEAIKSACDQQRFLCHVQTERMAELINKSDLAIGAGGTAVWERACLGLPTLSIATAQNQNEQLLNAADSGMLYSPGVSGCSNLGVHLQALLENPSLRTSLSQRSMQTVDGCGAWLVLNAMGVHSISMRTATEEDVHNLYEWRNHPLIRQTARNSEEIEWDSHKRWLSSAIASSKHALLIGERGGQPVGVVRFDLNSPAAEVSIYLVPGVSGKRLGSDLLSSAEHWLESNLPDVKTLHADVLGGNKRSQNFFASQGYLINSISFSKHV